MFSQAKDDSDSQQSTQNRLPIADLVQKVGHLKSEQCFCRTRGDIDVCSYLFCMSLICYLWWISRQRIESDLADSKRAQYILSA